MQGWGLKNKEKLLKQRAEDLSWLGGRCGACCEQQVNAMTLKASHENARVLAFWGLGVLKFWCSGVSAALVSET